MSINTYSYVGEWIGNLQGYEPNRPNLTSLVSHPRKVSGYEGCRNG